MNKMNKKRKKYQETEQHLCEALISILKRKRIDKISITELCHVAKVNRSTFYSHFDTVMDLYEVSKRYICELCQKAVSELLPEDHLTRKDYVLNNQLIKDVYLKPFLSVVKRYGEIFLIPEYSRLSEMFYENENNIINQFYQFQFQNIEDRVVSHYLALFFFSGVNSITQSWLSHGCKETIDEMCGIIMNCMSYKFE